MEIVDSLPEHLRLMVRLKAETQPRMQASKTLLQARNDVFFQRALSQLES